MRNVAQILCGFTLLPIFILFSVKKNNDKIEILLLHHRKHAFIDFYQKFIIKEKKRYQLHECDSLFDLTSTELFHEACLMIDFYSERHPSYIDENYILMINRWINKKQDDYAPLDNPNIKTTMAFKRAIDFYESEDLAKYIDSLRNVFYKKAEKGELRSLECID